MRGLSRGAPQEAPRREFSPPLSVFCYDLPFKSIRFKFASPRDSFLGTRSSGLVPRTRSKDSFQPIPGSAADWDAKIESPQTSTRAGSLSSAFCSEIETVYSIGHNTPFREEAILRSKRTCPLCSTNLTGPLYRNGSPLRQGDQPLRSVHKVEGKGGHPSRRRVISSGRLQRFITNKKGFVPELSMESARVCGVRESLLKSFFLVYRLVRSGYAKSAQMRRRDVRVGKARCSNGARFP